MFPDLCSGIYRLRYKLLVVYHVLAYVLALRVYFYQLRYAKYANLVYPHVSTLARYLEHQHEGHLVNSETNNVIMPSSIKLIYERFERIIKHLV